MRQIPITVLLALWVLAAAGCGSDAAPEAAQGADESNGVSIVVTTNILGDVVSAVVGNLADVEVIMPLGVDPHDFAPSVKQAEAMESADLLVINGANFEEGMLDLIEAVSESGTSVFSFADVIELIEGGEEEHSDEEEPADEDEHGHSGADPHLWTDPVRMIAGVEGLAVALAVIDGIDADALNAEVDAYVGRLDGLDTEIETLLADLPVERRGLVTNHEVFAYFAERYDFEVVGAVIPSLTTSAESSISELEDLAEIIKAEGIPAIFGETTQSSKLAEALADEVGGEVVIVELFAESLGEQGSGAETYIDMMRSNAELIADTLTGS